MTRLEWLMFQTAATLGLLAMAIGATVVPQRVEPLQVGPLLPASPAESQQWERDNLADLMRAGRP